MNPGARLDAVRRLTWLAAGLLVWAAAIFAKLVSLQVVHHDIYVERAQKQQEHRIALSAPRGTIFDRNGEPFAMSVPVVSVVIDPLLVPNKSIAAEILASILNLNPQILDAQIADAASHQRGFLYVKKKISRDESERLHNLHADWILFEEDSRRIYPKSQVAAHIIGTVYQGEKGAEGIEKGIDKTLAGAPGSATIITDVKRRGIESRIDAPAVAGKEVKLTIDERIQFVAERELAAQVKLTHGRSGSAIVMNPYTGEILAMANYPTFDPNKPPRTMQERRAHFNLGAQIPFEPGSIFKVLTLSTALETTSLHPDSIINCHNGVLALPGRVVHEAHHGFGMLSMADVLARSSNIGAIEIGAHIGREKFYEYLTNFGFGQRTGLELPAESKGTLRKLNHWGTTSLASISMGQEVAATSLQLVRVAAVIANGGLLVKPKLILDVAGKPTSTEAPKRVLRPETVMLMRGMMEGVVLSPHGTGHRLRLNGWTLAGKTGTAQIFEDHHYTHLYNASFMGFTPVNNPALVAIVTINGTTGDAGMGGAAAGPVWVKIMNEALRLYNVPKDLPDVPDPITKPSRDVSLNEVAEITGDRGANILEDDPSAMPSIASISVADGAADSGASQGEQGAALAPPSPGNPLQRMIPAVLQTAPPGTTTDAASATPASVPPAPVYSGPVAPDFQGKPMRDVVREAYSMGVTIKPEGSGVARAQKPAAGTPIRTGDSIRVLFAR